MQNLLAPGIFGGLIALCLVWAFFFANRQTFSWKAPPSAADQIVNGVTRSTRTIATASGELLEAWLYQPAGSASALIVMAPGLAGTKQGPLEIFAQHFAEQGFAIIAIDLPTFGASSGAPRHSIDLRTHAEAYVAAAAYAREKLSAKSLVLWGTSFSGASAACAAQTVAPDVLILHVPYVGKPARPPSPLQLSGYIALTIAERTGDALAALIGAKLAPVYIAAYGRPGEGAFGTSTQCPSRRNGVSAHPFWKLVPKDLRGGWRNLILVRDLQHLGAIDPATAIRQTKCKTLIVAATRDDMIAIDDVRALSGDSITLHEIDAGHFDPYVAPLFEGNVAVQAQFLRDHLPS